MFINKKKSWYTQTGARRLTQPRLYRQPGRRGLAVIRRMR